MRELVQANSSSSKSRIGQPEAERQLNLPEQGTPTQQSQATQLPQVHASIPANAAVLNRSTPAAASSPHRHLLQLQRQYGNRYVNQVIQRTRIQAKLALGAANDSYEQEADRVAQQVVSQISSSSSEPVQRQMPEDEEVAQTKPLIQRQMPEDEELMQTKLAIQRLATDETTEVAPDIEATIEQSRGNGDPLVESIRAPMEQAFGADFSGVKVHTDERSNQLNQSIQARAFTTGHDIFFRQGEYNPGSRSGQELIAHELTHVLQQNGGSGQPTMHMQAKSVHAGSVLEHKTDGLGLKAARNATWQRVPVRLSGKNNGSMSVQRVVYNTMANMWAVVEPSRTEAQIRVITDADTELAQVYADVAAHLANMDFVYHAGKQPEAEMVPTAPGIYRINYGLRTELAGSPYYDVTRYIGAILHEMMHITAGLQYATNVPPGGVGHIANMNLPVPIGAVAPRDAEFGLTDNQFTDPVLGAIAQVNTASDNWNHLSTEADLDQTKGRLTAAQVAVIKQRIEYAKVLPGGLAHYDTVLTDLLFFLGSEGAQASRSYEYAHRMLADANTRRTNRVGAIQAIPRAPLPQSFFQKLSSIFGLIQTSPLQMKSNDRATDQSGDQGLDATCSETLEGISHHNKQVTKLKAIEPGSSTISRQKIPISSQTGLEQNPIQLKVASLITGDQEVWYDDENIALGFFPTKLALLEAMRDQPVKLFDITGRNLEQIREISEFLPTPVSQPIKLYQRKTGPYTYRYTAFDPKGLCRLEVTTPGEPAAVGFVQFIIEDLKPLARPKEHEPYTKEHVLAREGKVAHLTHLYNTTLQRNGPADIYSGFGVQLLKMAEQDAKLCGAKLMYLEAASSMVRTDPNTNEKKLQNSISFYTKFGYGTDAASAAHNWGYAMRESERFGLPLEGQITYVQGRVKSLLGGMLSKELK
jgi:hypothetical protein